MTNWLKPSKHVILLTLLLLIVIPWPVVILYNNFGSSASGLVFLPVFSFLILLASFFYIVENIAILITAIIISYVISSALVYKLKPKKIRQLEIALSGIIIAIVVILLLIVLPPTR